jgi:cytochrome c biogenesis protein CcdA
MASHETAQTRPRVRVEWQGIGFLLLGLALGGLLILGRQGLYVAQDSVASTASILPVSYAFGAGMVATVNPCGVLLLPSLVAYYLSRDETVALTGWVRAGKALVLAMMATLGFVTLFGIVGGVIGAGGWVLADAFPIGGFLTGICLLGLGAWLALSGRSLGLLRASQAMGYVRLGDDLLSLFLFGVAYAVASLACTLPIFLVVVSSALASGSALVAIGQFMSYALGMGSVLTLVVLAAAFLQGAVWRSLRRVVPYVHRLSAAFLLGAGLFLVYDWLA